MLRAFFGHHKAATTWIRSILRDASIALGLDMQVINTPDDWAGYSCLGDWVRAKSPDVIVLPNATIEDVKTLPEMRGFHVTRDPRDVIVSGYFSHRNSHEESFDGLVWTELPPHRKALQELDKEAGLLAEIEFSGQHLDKMSAWSYDLPGVLEFKMEDMIADPLPHWRRILGHFELDSTEKRWDEAVRMAMVNWNLAPRRGTARIAGKLRRFLPPVPMHRLPVSYLPWTLDRYSFSNLTGGRPPGQEDPGHHFRRGVAGDWRNHLNDKHLAAIRARYGDLVERLGYDT